MCLVAMHYFYQVVSDEGKRVIILKEARHCNHSIINIGVWIHGKNVIILKSKLSVCLV